MSERDDEPHPSDQTAALAAMLRKHVDALAAAAEETVERIERDRETIAVPGAGEPDELIGTVEGRVRELAEDCHRLSVILSGFEDLVTEAAEEDAAEEPEPVLVHLDDAAEAEDDEVAPEGTAAPDEPWEDDEEAPDADAGLGEPEDDPFETPGSSNGAGDGAPEAVEAAAPQSTGNVRVSEGIRLLATQMSVAGATNEEIVKRLRDDFGVEDADRVVAHLFGSAGGSPA
jgi:hypothetical protein